MYTKIRDLLVPFSFVVIMIIVMRWQGSALVTPQTPAGIIDLEFAKTPERLEQYRLFINTDTAIMNLYIDFLFIIAYVWFFTRVTGFIIERNNWSGAGKIFLTLGFFAGMCDIGENLLLLDALQQSGTALTMNLAFYLAAAKFILAGIVLLYILVSIPFIIKSYRYSK